jgi:hypothetical protein
MSAPPELPLGERVQLAHASVQALANQQGADILLLKGPTTAPGLRAAPSAGTDVDAWVRPGHEARLVAALGEAGWEAVTDFTSGSAFDHAANFYHPHWGLADVHRLFPGLDSDPAAAFERLWERRQTRLVAHYPCNVVDFTGQALIILLHAARSPHEPGHLHPDAVAAWFDQDDAHRIAVRALATELGALTPLAVAIGRGDDVRDRPDAALWLWFAEGGSRLEQWSARLKSAPTPWAKISIARRSLSVNRYSLSQKLGHAPTEAEVRMEFLRRLRQAASELGTVVTRRAKSRWRR